VAPSGSENFHWPGKKLFIYFNIEQGKNKILSEKIYQQLKPTLIFFHVYGLILQQLLRIEQTFKYFFLSTLHTKITKNRKAS
jgi:hypothetical protein